MFAAARQEEPDLRAAAQAAEGAAQSALLRPVISRLTSFGSGSPAGAEMAAVFLTVYGTLRLQGLNPNTWTLAYLEACAR